MKTLKIYQGVLRTLSATWLVFGVYGSASADFDLNWQSAANGALPFDAVVGGKDVGGQSLFFCRALYQGGNHPGKIRPGFTGCSIPYGGKEVSVPNYEVLTPGWIGAANGVIPPGAFPWGKDANGDPLFACRALYQGSLYPGKLKSALGGCSIGYGGNEVVVKSYDVFMGTNVASIGPGWFGGLPVRSVFQGSKSNGLVPSDAIVGGYFLPPPPLLFSTTLYLCQADYTDPSGAFSIQPGYTNLSSGSSGCTFGYGGKEVTVTEQYSVQIPNYELQTTPPTVPSFVAGGENDGTPLFACQASHSGSEQPGKYKPGFGCYIPYGGAEILISVGFVILTK